MRLQCCFLVVFLLFADVLQAQQVTWQNDTAAAGQDGTIQTGFASGDIGAAVFDVPCGMLPLQIKKVQVLWRSQVGPTTQVMTHVHVYGSGAPVPGSPLFTGEGALMTAGYMNEFSVPGQGWTVNQSPFTIGIEYINDLGQPVDTSSGHLTTDADGCQPGKNLIYNSATVQWIDPCAFGMLGDFVIRVVFEPMGTGCFLDSDCDSDVDMSDFAALQGCLSGDGATAVQECLVFDCNGDGDVDLTDYAAGCPTGPGTTCDPGCGVCSGASAAPNPDRNPLALLGSAMEVLRSSVDGMFPPTLDGTVRDGAIGEGARWTLIGVLVVITIITFITVYFIGPCTSAACRQALGLQFRQKAVNPDSAEQIRINQGLDWLLYDADDQQAEECVTWYDSHLARQSTLFGTVQVNHWADRQGIVGSRILVENKVSIHVSFVTGPEFSPELLALILFAEWQHIDQTFASEESLEVELKAFRQRVGLTELRPEFQHGPAEP